MADQCCVTCRHAKGKDLSCAKRGCYQFRFQYWEAKVEEGSGMGKTFKGVDRKRRAKLDKDWRHAVRKVRGVKEQEEEAADREEGLADKAWKGRA